MTSSCPHCKGLIVEADFHDHGVWHMEYRCVNCGRYYPVDIRTHTVDMTPELKRSGEYKPWRRISEDVLTKAKGLLQAGECVSAAAKAVGILPASLYKIVKRNGWQVQSGRPNRRDNDELIRTTIT